MVYYLWSGLFCNSLFIILKKIVGGCEMKRNLLSKKVINDLVRVKDTETIIKLYELEQKQNPFTIWDLNKNFTELTYCQKEALKEQVKSGKTFGLAKDFYYELKDLLGLGRVTRNESGEKFFIEYRERQTDLIYPF
jgi:hypothetical protein